MAHVVDGPELAPLVDVARRLRACHLSLFGSAVRRPIAEAGDVDVHLVVPRVDAPTMAAIGIAAATAAHALASAAGRRGLVELRHGPLTPPVRSRPPRPLQLHLIIDDVVSLGATPCVVLAHRAATGRLLAGRPLGARWQHRDRPAVRRVEALAEVVRWHEALVTSTIPCREWTLGPRPCLVAVAVAATSATARARLLRGAVRAVGLHLAAAAAHQPSGPDLLALVELRALLTDPRRWGPRRDAALAILERERARLTRR